VKHSVGAVHVVWPYFWLTIKVMLSDKRNWIREGRYLRQFKGQWHSYTRTELGMRSCQMQHTKLICRIFVSGFEGNASLVRNVISVWQTWIKKLTVSLHTCAGGYQFHTNNSQ